MLLLVGCLWGLCLVVVSGWFTPLCFTCVLNFMLWRVCSRHCIVVSPGHVYQGGSSDWWHWQGPSRENGMEGWHRTGQTQRWNYCPAGSRHQNWQERLESILRSKFLVVSLHTHTRLTALCPGLPGWAGTRKVKPICILLKRETVSGSGIRWAICKSAPRSRQITTPAPHRSVFYRPDAFPAAQPTASKHWRDSKQWRESKHWRLMVTVTKTWL